MKDKYKEKNTEKNTEKNANSNKSTIIAIIVAALLIVFAIIYTRGGITIKNGSGQDTNGGITNSNNKIPANNVSIVDGVQIIQIKAKGGYLPRESVAKAGIPTILRFSTNGTFDCSSSVRIPSMNIFKSLPQSGTTDIDLGTQAVGTLEGTCGMGMYPFGVEFK